MTSRRLSLAIVVLMTAIFAAALAVPAVSAVGYEDIVLTDLTRVNPVQYQVTVVNPGAISQEDDYLNMTVFVEPLGTGANHITLQVLFYLNDGTTNVSLGNKTLAAVDDATAWSNLSYSSVGMAAFVTNGTALLTVQLWYLNTTATPDDYVMLDQYHSTFGIYNTQMAASLFSYVPIIVTIAIFAAIIPMLRKMGGKKR